MMLEDALHRNVVRMYTGLHNLFKNRVCVVTNDVSKYGRSDLSCRKNVMSKFIY